MLRSSPNKKPPKADDLQGSEAARAEEQKDKDKPLDPKAGVNRFVWDMRIVKPTLAPKAVFNEGTKNPPKVAPGNYSVRLTVDGKTSTQPIVVEPHPAGYATAADLKAQYELLKAIRDRLSETHDTVVQQIRDVRAQVEGDRRSRRAGSARATRWRSRRPAIADAADGGRGRADQPADRGRRGRPELRAEARPRLGRTWPGIVASADAKPLASSRRVLQDADGRLDAARSQYRAILDRDVKAFNQAVVAAGSPPVAPAPKAAG